MNACMVQTNFLSVSSRPHERSRSLNQSINSGSSKQFKCIFSDDDVFDVGQCSLDARHPRKVMKSLNL